MRAAAAVVLLLPLLGGCVDEVRSERPDDWQAGVALSAFSGHKAHSADEGFMLRPPADTAVDMPARCVAYQSGKERADDDCDVRGETTTWDGRVVGPWVLEASWSGRGERLYEDVERHPERRTVVAFDGAGAVVAYWDGLARDADGDFSTE